MFPSLAISKSEVVGAPNSESERGERAAPVNFDSQLVSED